MFDFYQAIMSLKSNDRLFECEWSGGTASYIDREYGHEVPFFYHTTLNKMVVWYVVLCEVCYCEEYKEWQMCDHVDNSNSPNCYDGKEFKKSYIENLYSNYLTLF